MKIALAQMNSFTGNILFNEKKIREFIIKARKKNAQLLIFPEMSLNGYSPLDLLKRKFFLRQITRSVQRIHKQVPKDMAVLMGATGPGFPPRISIFFLQRNKPVKIFSKGYLADYDVFDEQRYFKKGRTQDNFFVFKDHLIQILICEEIWQTPVLQNKNSPDLIISLNASPFSLNKDQKRVRVSRKWVKKYQCPLIYLNSVGGQEELIFDGGSFILDQSGKQIYQNIFFQENLTYFQFPNKKFLSPASPEQSIYSKQEKITQALIFGLREFIKKNGFKYAHLGLSGGVDSALVAALACKALGEKKVRLFFLPGPFTSHLSEQCAFKMAKKLKCPLIIQTIENFYFDFFKS